MAPQCPPEMVCHVFPHTVMNECFPHVPVLLNSDMPIPDGLPCRHQDWFYEQLAWVIRDCPLFPLARHVFWAAVSVRYWPVSAKLTKYTYGPTTARSGATTTIAQ